VETPDPAATRATALTMRLVLGYLAVALLTLSSAAVFLHQRLYHSFEVEDAELLNAHVQMLRHEMESRPGDLHEASEVILSTSRHRSLEKYYGQLLDQEGKVLIETPGFSELAPEPVAFPPPVGESEDISEVLRYQHSPQKAPAFLASAWVKRDDSRPLLLYRVALDISHVDQWMREFRNLLIWVIGAGTALSGVLAWFLTRRGLQPLQDITAAMQRVGSSGLNERLGRNPWPQELADMAGEFDLMLERLKESFQKVSQFSADAAHEFRTPLNNLMVHTGLMLAQDRDVEEYRQALASNIEEYERLKSMVDSLLFIARADNAEAVLNRTTIDLGALVTEIFDFYSALAEEREVTLTLEGGGKTEGDVTLLRLAISNLVSNALRHTPTQGGVVVRVREMGEHSSIEISDTGEGIAPEHLPKLFDRFYRVDIARSALAKDKGVGLGLALVKTVVQLHGGEVSVASTLGSGTTMRIIIPAAHRTD
jgi:two-component system heavy metal sensor histidine kinase CusS